MGEWGVGWGGEGNYKGDRLGGQMGWRIGLYRDLIFSCS